MGLIDWYIMRRVAALTVPTLLVISGIVVTTQLLINVEMVTRSAAAAFGFLMIALLLVPSITLLVIPFAILIGALRTLATMNGDSELAVLEATGRAPRATTRPILAFSLLASLLTALAAHTIEPAAGRAMQDTLSAAGADLIRSAVRSGTFTQLRSGVFVQVGRELPNGEMASIVMIDTSEPDTQVIHYARRGNLVEHEGATLLALADGEVHRQTLSNGAVSIISFATSAIEVAASKGPQVVAYRLQSNETGELLSRVATEQAAGNRAGEDLQELHRRFTEWLYPLLFGAIACLVAASATSHRQSRALPAVAGVAVALGLRAIGFVTISMAATSPTAAALSYAIPLTAIAVVLLMIYTGRTIPVPRALADAAVRIAALAKATRRSAAGPAGPAA
jgi:lipopolysaccharide export system permease protein